MPNPTLSRRELLKAAAAAGAATGAAAMTQSAEAAAPSAPKPLYKISLAEWSLHRTLRKGEITNLDFPRVSKQEYGIDCVEYVNQFFKDKAKDQAYLNDLLKRCKDEGVKNNLIMIDGEGRLGAPGTAERQQAVENHYPWVEAAKFLGCHAIRVNAASEGSYEDQMNYAADGLRKLTEFGAKHNISVIVENHGGLSSNGAWLAGVMKKVGHKGCGTLPDFGNFRISPTETYDKYRGVEELMPFAKAVSAKSHVFNSIGDEEEIDYRVMMRIVLDHGYRDYVGIEYEGDKHSEKEGILLTKRLLEKVREEMSRKA
jgi:sugar phosphate isomerase/epimerase